MPAPPLRDARPPVPVEPPLGIGAPPIGPESLPPDPVPAAQFALADTAADGSASHRPRPGPGEHGEAPSAAGPSRGAGSANGDRAQMKRRTMRGMVIMGGSTAGQAVLQIVFLSLLARTVAPKEFGLVSGALIAVFLTTVLAESGVGVAIVQRATLTREHVRVGWTLSVGLGVLSWGLLSLLAPQIEELLRLPGLSPILRTISLIFVINNLTLSDYLLSRRLQFGKLALAEFTSYAVGYGGVAITLAYLGYGPWAIVWGQLAQSVMRTTTVTVMAPYRYGLAIDRGPMKELLNFGGGYTIGRVALWAATQIDNLVVSRYLGAAALGLYGRAYQLVQMPANLFGQVANEVLFPAMAAVQDQQETLRRVFRLSVSFLAALALPTSVLAAVTSRDLVLTLLGPDWLPLRAAFDVIIFGLLFRTSSKLTDSVMKARGAVYRRAWRSIVFAAAVFVGAFVGQHWGLHGVAVGVLIALGVNYLLTNYLCLVLVGMTWRGFAAAHLPAIIISIAAGGVGLAAQELLLRDHFGAAGRLAVVWLLGLAAALVVVRSAWRTRLLGSVAGLVVAMHGMLFGKAARVARRLLGPGYASRLGGRQAVKA